MSERPYYLALGFVSLASGLAVLSLMLLSNIQVPDPSSNRVLVPAQSPAAQRGFALPGEGSPVRLEFGRPALSNITRYSALGCLILAAVLFLPRIERFRVRDFIGHAFGGAFAGGMGSPFFLFFSPNTFAMVLVLILIITSVYIWHWSGKKIGR